MSSTLSAVEIIAHRGASYDAPENTVAAARLGWEQGADAVEIDIHASPIGLIVIHDHTTNRTTGQSLHVDQLTEDQRLACDAGAWKGARFAGEKIPLLEDVVAAMPPGGRLVIEVKTPGTFPRLPEILKNSGRDPGRFIIIAFDPEIAADAKLALPGSKVLRLASYEPREPALHIDELIRVSREAGLDGLNLSRKWPIDAALVRKVHDAGLLFYVWTVDDPGDARRFKEAGVDGITTNRPGWLREQLAERN
jgi:glycerophosphoryl diester phosphodiesterase